MFKKIALVTVLALALAIPAVATHRSDHGHTSREGTMVEGSTANDTAVVENPLLLGGVARSQGSNPTPATAGNKAQLALTPEGLVLIQEGLNRFSCFKEAISATTECQAAPAAGLRAYVTGLVVSNQVATVQTVDVVYGTGTNCGTGTTALTHKHQMGTNATTTSPFVVSVMYKTPLVPVAANAICVRPSAATAFGVTITGFIAP